MSQLETQSQYVRLPRLLRRMRRFTNASQVRSCQLAKLRVSNTRPDTSRRERHIGKGGWKGVIRQRQGKPSFRGALPDCFLCTINAARQANRYISRPLDGWQPVGTVFTVLCITSSARILSASTATVHVNQGLPSLLIHSTYCLGHTESWVTQYTWTRTRRRLQLRVRWSPLQGQRHPQVRLPSSHRRRPRPRLPYGPDRTPFFPTCRTVC